jgi:hypothetical protein
MSLREFVLESERVEDPESASRGGKQSGQIMTAECPISGGPSRIRAWRNTVNRKNVGLNVHVEARPDGNRQVESDSAKT